ncbi:aminodeoxychorismate/anthranilate synthase component II [Xenorhabdus bovienii]|uniref:Aminodeoxychorismate synthase subunit II,component of p-aminobenzoate synthase multienzyme complex n=1 Tax=Xenorhabdus bovienii str. puntauvense TaxID=1398201 RepID=A0A077NK43_XENBV|nr:aminodeoxychorismate/anthranilate synthase component II [Xenorhabdus bovienii]MCG3471127.1 aminodeoxychorismate/anthranilate synthase component II [Xenorhabdus bovienii]CDG87542.1 aminodeoxychorismate synthase subunit II,component of p-aminobenzoate synthase multienzyme complex [Xenorhabdus bovienii str. feltiae France]CDG94139.1 aminodeoxychorismate synthase subunit II,component of p-aminobenzoate synthase multienzyme complex [Xenorhabdus bovienii str. feltiae Florida]CDG98230.1 aminodeoxyc
MYFIIDNYDSFTYNIAQYLGMLGIEVLVKKNDRITLEYIEQHNPTGLIISPGPCTPNEAGISTLAIQHFAGKIPILGICLGHQCIAQEFGGQVLRANKVYHGHTLTITHNDKNLFANLPQDIKVGCYHSLVVDDLPECLTVTARSCDEYNDIMALKHNDFPIYGVQFHPESILSDFGLDMLKNFIKITQEWKLMNSIQ